MVLGLKVPWQLYGQLLALPVRRLRGPRQESTSRAIKSGEGVAADFMFSPALDFDQPWS